MSAFHRYIGIDYSGAKTPSARLSGLRAYLSEDGAAPVELRPQTGAHWSRRSIAELLASCIATETPTMVGIDHGFSFPKAYFEAHGLTADWHAFLDDFCAHWPTDTDIYVDFVREGVAGNGAARKGNARWRRLTEYRARGAKSVFHFDVPGSVAKATHAGIPWLRLIRDHLQERIHFWPFDGWDIPAGRSAIVEVYPALWNRRERTEGRTNDQHDAYCAASWLAQADRNGDLSRLLWPRLRADEDPTARIEGWILGVD